MNRENKIVSEFSRPQKVLALVMGAIIAMVVMILILKDSQGLLSML